MSGQGLEALPRIIRGSLRRRTEIARIRALGKEPRQLSGLPDPEHREQSITTTLRGNFATPSYSSPLPLRCVSVSCFLHLLLSASVALAWSAASWKKVYG